MSAIAILRQPQMEVRRSGFRLRELAAAEKRQLGLQRLRLPRLAGQHRKRVQLATASLRLPRQRRRCSGKKRSGVRDIGCNQRTDSGSALIFQEWAKLNRIHAAENATVLCTLIQGN